MPAPISRNENYNQLESLDIMLQSATEYIPRHFKRTRPENLRWVGAFLWCISEGLTVRDACSRAGVGYSSVFAERDRNPDFAAAWEEAIRCGHDVFEGIAAERAKEKSDLLMMFILKSRDPGRFNDKAQGQKGKELHIEITHRYPDKESLPVIEVQSRSVTPDSHQLTDEHTDPIDVTPRKD